MKAAKEKGEKLPTEDPLEITRVVLEKLKAYMSSGPVIAMVWQGAHSVELVRKIVGGTEPRSSDVGTIRGDFSFDSSYLLILLVYMIYLHYRLFV